ncbi:MAG: cyclohydrolase [Chloroflexota bacterium]|jgi:GTP cyclohydrolase I|nr:cyclohydrolase [Chloroflexota bacterium]
MEFLDHEEARLETSFHAEQTGQLIVVSGIRTWSVCEHHLLPFETKLAVGYLPGPRVLGLSKFARAARKVAHKLQLQERLVAEFNAEIQSLTQCDDVAVLGRGRHLCLEARGPRSAARMANTSYSGGFRSDPALRAEFLALAG